MNDAVAKHFPSATRAKDVTLLELGPHVTGYRDYYPLDFEPVSRWSYSNTNFLILGKAVEAAAGQTSAAFMKERIFTPIGMTRTS